MSAGGEVDECLLTSTGREKDEGGEQRDESNVMRLEVFIRDMASG